MIHQQFHPRPGLPLAFVAAVCTTFLMLSGCARETPQEASMEADSTETEEAAGPPEGTDVWLLDLMWEGDTLRAKAPRNLTRRPGYDNQPLFTPAGNLLFVQMEAGKTDIWRWDTATESTTRLTVTPEQGEFSPTPIPASESGISYIRSPDDTSGRLWRMLAEDAAAEIVFPDIGPVGYHAWFDADFVALWLLQEPSVLQVIELDTQEARTIATDVGRSPQSVPSRRAVSYTRASEEGEVIEIHDLDLEGTEALTLLPEGGEFHAWTPDGALLSTAGSRVFLWRDGGWQTVVDLDHLGLKLSRLAVSPGGERLALVAEPAP
ncbi:MAG: hypothetical protein AAGA95_06670 [Pseudomonadota bacterium]